MGRYIDPKLQPGKGNKMIQNYITCIYVYRFQNIVAEQRVAGQ